MRSTTALGSSLRSLSSSPSGTAIITQPFLEQRVDTEEERDMCARSLNSDAIVGTLTKMTDEAEDSRTITRKREGEPVHEFAMLKNSFQGEITTWADAPRGDFLAAELSLGRCSVGWLLGGLGGVCVVWLCSSRTLWVPLRPRHGSKAKI